MKRSRQGLGAAGFFAQHRVQPLSEGEISHFFGEVSRIRTGRGVHGRQIVLKDLRSLPQFSSNGLHKVQPTLGAQRESTQVPGNP